MNIAIRLRLAVSLAAIAALACAGVASAAEAPIKEELASHLGGIVATDVGVNNDPRSPGFGDVYVVDSGNSRVQVLTASGAFVLMFGGEVNETKVDAVKAKGGTPTQAEREEENVCTAESKDLCKAGVEGAAAGQFGETLPSVAVDPGTGSVYVQDVANARVEEFTSSGEFVLMLGKEVDATTKGGVCAAASKDVCQAGVPGTAGGDEDGTFDFESVRDGVLAVGGPEDLLYVGDEHRVQEFKADGTWVRELPLAAGGIVTALAVNRAGDVYLSYAGASSVRELAPTGQAIMEFSVLPNEPDAGVEIGTLALDESGHLAVSALEAPSGSEHPLDRWFGSLYAATTGHLLTEFFGAGPGGFGFNDGSEALYAAANNNTISGTGNEVLVYKPLPVGELLTGAATCRAGAERETDATFDCALGGAVDAWGVKETDVSFQWGATPSLGEATAPPSSIANVKGAGEEEPLVQVSAPLVGLLPNATYYYKPVGYDENVKPPEKALSGDRMSFTTPAVPPRIVGEPSASYVGLSSAVLFGELNPENANTEYFFEYGACPTLAQCAETQIATTTDNASSTYGTIGTTLEATGLQPASVYSYRLFAQSENTAKTGKLKVTGPEGTFTTAPAAVPQASTGASSAVTSTSAVVSGAATPDGQPATYAFELGVYGGASTRYGIVFSGSAGASVGSVGESLALSGLQPGTTYAYRIVVNSGYGTATGEAVLFMTAGLPAVLVSPSSLAMLTVPSIVLPTETKVAATTKKTTPKRCVKGKKLSHGRCIRTKAKKTKKAKKSSTKEM